MKSQAPTALLDDRFLLLEALGRGGMGCVYRAFDRVEERLVALKVLLSRESFGPAHPLSTEYEVWSRLRHPNIVRAYELGRAVNGPLPSGTPYLVLENFSGLPAHEALQAGRVHPGHLEEFARRVLHALDHVHGAGLVHRDLKPNNVLVGATRQGPGRIKLTDFGLAAKMGRADQPGCVSGSVLFVAPESVIGQPVDGRTDLYGLGILLYLLATGRMPVQSRDPCEILRWHLEGSPPDPRKLNPRVSERLSRFVKRLTARNPDERPGSCEEALVLLGGRKPPSQPLRRSGVGRAEKAALRFALDAVRLGALRQFDLPVERTACTALMREAAVVSQVHGLLFCRLRSGRRRGFSTLGRLVLRLLVKSGPRVRRLVHEHGLHRGLPLGLLGGLPVWDRLRAETEAEPTDPSVLQPTAWGVARFLLGSCERQPMVLVVEKGALTDPLALRVVELLVSEVKKPEENLPRKGGLLVILPKGVAGGSGRGQV